MNTHSQVWILSVCVCVWRTILSNLFCVFFYRFLFPSPMSSDCACVQLSWSGTFVLTRKKPTREREKEIKSIIILLLLTIRSISLWMSMCVCLWPTSLKSCVFSLFRKSNCSNVAFSCLLVCCSLLFFSCSDLYLANLVVYVSFEPNLFFSSSSRLLFVNKSRHVVFVCLLFYLGVISIKYLSVCRERDEAKTWNSYTYTYRPYVSCCCCCYCYFFSSSRSRIVVQEGQGPRLRYKKPMSVYVRVSFLWLYLCCSFFYIFIPLARIKKATCTGTHRWWWCCLFLSLDRCFLSYARSLVLMIDDRGE